MTANSRDRRVLQPITRKPASRIRPELCLNDARTQSYRRSSTHAYDRSLASARIYVIMRIIATAHAQIRTRAFESSSNDRTTISFPACKSARKKFTKTQWRTLETYNFAIYNSYKMTYTKNVVLQYSQKSSSLYVKRYS